MTSNELTGLFFVIFVSGAFILSSILHILRSLRILKDKQIYSSKEIQISRLDLIFSVPILIGAIILFLYFLITRL
jgi:hypothetical protein